MRQGSSSSTLQASRIPTGQLQHTALLQALETGSLPSVLRTNVINQGRGSKTEKQALYGAEGDEIPASGKELPDRCEGKGCREKKGPRT